MVPTNTSAAATAFLSLPPEPPRHDSPASPPRAIPLRGERERERAREKNRSKRRTEKEEANRKRVLKMIGEVNALREDVGVDDDDEGPLPSPMFEEAPHGRNRSPPRDPRIIRH